MDKLILILYIISMIFTILSIVTIFFNIAIGVFFLVCFVITLAIANIITMIAIFKD